MTYAYDQYESNGLRDDDVNDSRDGVVTSSYDVEGRLVEVRSPQGAVSYTYDQATGRETTVATSNTLGRRTSAVESTDGLPRTVSYTYDAEGRLTSEADTDATLGNTATSYGYDLAGNRIERDYTHVVSGSPVTDKYVDSYDANGELTQELLDPMKQYKGQIVALASITYAYNLDGEQTGKTVTGSLPNESDTYAWDEEGRMTGAVTVMGGITTTVAYGYDDAGIRVATTVNGAQTKYLVDENRAYAQVLEEYAPGGVLAATYVRGLDLLFQDRTGARAAPRAGAG